MGTVPIEKFDFDSGTMPAAWIISELIRLSDEEYHIIGLEQVEMVDDVKVVKCIELDEVRRHVSPRAQSGVLHCCVCPPSPLPPRPPFYPPLLQSNRRSPPPAT